MMPDRQAFINTPVVVWGNTQFANGSSFSMDFGDGSAVVNGTVGDRSYINFVHTYTTAGIKTATLTVGTESEGVQITVLDPASVLLTAADVRGARINMAIEEGLRWLYENQDNRAGAFGTNKTSWATNRGDADYSMSYTSLVVLALENHGHNVLNDPTRDIYQAVVQRGLNFLFDNLSIVPIGDEGHGTPCVGVPADADQCKGLGRPINSGHSMYASAVSTLAVAGSGAMNRTVDSGLGAANGNFVAGRTYGDILQRQANLVVWGQEDASAGGGRGGFGYILDDNTRGVGSDGSTLGWAMLALLDANAAGATIPAFVASELTFALQLQLAPDGSLMYRNFCCSGTGSFTKVGIGLQALYYTGAPLNDPRVQNAINYISNRWNNRGADDGFFCSSNGTFNKGCAYAMFNVFKGLKLYGVNTLPGVTRPAGPGSIPAGDWHAEYQDYLVASQQGVNTVGGGVWQPAGMGWSCCDTDSRGITALAELILAPVALVLPSNLTLAPPTGNSPALGTHTVTATATTAGGSPVAAATVTFTVLSGPNQGVTGTGVTDASGVATFTYTDAVGGGTDTIRASLATLQSNTVTMTWAPINQPPVAQCQDVTVSADAQCKATASVNNGSFDPDAGDTISVSQSPAGPFGLGTTSVTLTVTDSHDATNQCTANVVVKDTTAPALTCLPGQTLECTGNRSATATVSATATDNCDPAVQASCATPPNNSYPVGQTPVTCSATDASGNTGSCTTSVTVVDTRAPAVSCSAPQVVECTGPNGTAATVTASAVDVCDGSINAVCSTPAGGLYAVGTTQVTCSAADLAGNRGGCTTTVQVVDTTPPVVSCVQSVNPSGSNIPRASNTNQDGFYRVAATDICSPGATAITIGSYQLASGETIKITQSPGQNGVRLLNTMGPLQIKHFQVGPGDAVLVARDASGNTSTVTCLVPPRPQ